MRVRPSLLLFGSFALAATLPAQQSTPSAGTKVARAVDAKVLRAHLEFLCG